MTIKNAIYAQSGGVTAVINASACAVIQTAKFYPQHIGKVYAAKNGIIGALNEELIDTSLETDADIAKLLQTPAGAFGSCRYKLKNDGAEYERLIEVFKAHNIGYFSITVVATLKIRPIKYHSWVLIWDIPSPVLGYQKL